MGRQNTDGITDRQQNTGTGYYLRILSPGGGENEKFWCPANHYPDPLGWARGTGQSWSGVIPSQDSPLPYWESPSQSLGGVKTETRWHAPSLARPGCGRNWQSSLPPHPQRESCILYTATPYDHASDRWPYMVYRMGSEESVYLWQCGGPPAVSRDVLGGKCVYGAGLPQGRQRIRQRQRESAHAGGGRGRVPPGAPIPLGRVSHTHTCNPAAPSDPRRVTGEVPRDTVSKRSGHWALAYGLSSFCVQDSSLRSNPFAGLAAHVCARGIFGSHPAHSTQ